MELDKNKGYDDRDTEIELRSGKVRAMAGDIPRRLMVIGLAVILFIILLLAAALILIPYPYSYGESILRHMMGGYGDKL